FSRWRARRLLGQGLSRARALLAAGKLPAAIRPALRVPREAPAGAGEHRGILFGAQLVRGARREAPLLLRLSALPRPPRRLDALEPARFRLDLRFRPAAAQRWKAPRPTPLDKQSLALRALPELRQLSVLQPR